MARQQGARAQMVATFESVYGTAPAAGFRRVPFVSTDLGSEQPLLDNEVLGFGRDPLAPTLDAFSSDGSVVIPMDLENLGFWLKGTFGQPVTVASVAATGSVAFSAQPAVNSTITINGVVFTFVASGATGNQVNIGANLAATLTSLASILNANGTVGGAFATYAATATALNITRGTLGPVGNAFTLAASSAPASNATVSGATLTGGANDHTFTSGSWTLPSMAIETQMPDVPKFSMYSGVVVDELSWEMKRAGLLQATVKMVAQGESIVAASAAGALSGDLNYKRFGHFNGSILRNGVSLGNITSARVNYMNNLDKIETIRGDGRIDGADPSIAACKGQIVSRFADLTLYNQAIAQQACALEFRHTIGASEKFVFTAHAVYLPRPRTPIEGPNGVEATFDWQAALATSPARMITCVLTNAVASY
jgi:Phage tail tube protein